MDARENQLVPETNFQGFRVPMAVTIADTLDVQSVKK